MSWKPSGKKYRKFTETRSKRGSACRASRAGSRVSVGPAHPYRQVLRLSENRLQQPDSSVFPTVIRSICAELRIDPSRVWIHNSIGGLNFPASALGQGACLRE